MPLFKFSVSTPECFICCTDHGKSEKEILTESFDTKSKTMNYPIICLSYAYGCNCKTTFAHNNCLKTIFKCPTCRKEVVKPNLRVIKYPKITNNFLFNWIDKNPIKFKQIVKIFAFIGIVIVIINLLEKNNYLMTSIHLQILFLVILIIMYGMIQINDYVNKYWLYNEVTKTFY